MTAPPSRGALAVVAAVALVAAALAVGSVAALGADGPAGGTDRLGGDAVATPSAPNGTNATAMVAPRGSVDRLASVAAIERGREAGWVTPSPVLAAGDTLVLRLRLPGMAGRVANASGDTADARFRSVLAGESVSLRLVQRHTSPERSRKVFYLNGSRGQVVTADPANDTYYVAANLAAISDATGGPGTDYHIRNGDFIPRLVVNGEHRLNPGPIGAPNRTARFVRADREARFSGADDGALSPGFAAAPNQTVAGHTTLAPGSTVSITVTNATGIEVPRTATARVSRATTDDDPPKFVFETGLNLSGVDPGTGISLAVASNGTVISDGYEHDRYRAPVDSPGAAVDLRADPILDDSIRIERATLPAGGFVVVERTSDGTVVGSSDYLDAGTHEGLRVRVSGHVADNSTLRVSLARDSDGDGQYFVSADRYYADSMRPAGASVSRAAASTATVTATATPTVTPTATPTDVPTTVESPTPTTPEPTETPTAAPTTEPSTVGDSPRTDPPAATTSGDGPGFGGTLAVAALAVAGLLAVTRRWEMGRR